MDAMNVTPAPSAWHSLWLEARCEFLRMLRMPSFVVPTLMFPLMFYLLFGVFMGSGKAGYQAAHWQLASFCVMGVLPPGLFGFGVVVAMERERGLLRLKRALPMPPQNYLLAKLAMAMLFAAIIFAALGVLSTTLGGVRLELGQWLGLGATAVLGVLPFCALGLLLGTLVSGQAAPAIVNVIFLPMSFLSGVAIPLFAMPAAIQDIAPLWPAFHLNQISHAVIGQPAQGSLFGHAAVLAGFAALCFAIARRRLARGE